MSQSSATRPQSARRRSFPPLVPPGLNDIYGNVCEWVQDGWEATYYGQFQGKSALDPNGPSPGGSQQVFRGSGWGGTASPFKFSYRYAMAPSGRHYSLGFRVSLVLDAVKAAIAERKTEPAHTKQAGPKR